VLHLLLSPSVSCKPGWPLRPGGEDVERAEGDRLVVLAPLAKSERRVSNAKGQVPLQTSEFVRSFKAQAHEIVETITAVVINAEAGSTWLCADPPDLEGVRLALDGIASDGRRAAELVVRLRALMNKVVDSG
jgi:hypothetical protein